MQHFLLSLLCFLGVSLSSYGIHRDLEPLRKPLQQVAEGVAAQVGIALLTDEGDSLTLNNSLRYPLMSVFKFHQALGVAYELERKGLPLTKKIHLAPEDLRPGTWSPLREKHPEGNIDLSIADLLTYTLQFSDNNVCDVLFDRFLSPYELNRFLRKKTGITDCHIAHNEADMGKDYRNCYANWISPYAAVQLLQQFLHGKIVAEPYLSCIKENMLRCQTGKNKLAAPLLGTAAIIGQKTGSGPMTPTGRHLANNDLAFVQLPQQGSYCIAVFIKDAQDSAERTDRLIAEISSIIYQYFYQPEEYGSSASPSED